MSWLQKLSDTYDAASDATYHGERLPPILSLIHI